MSEPTSAIQLVSDFCHAHLVDDSREQKNLMQALKNDFGFTSEMNREFMQHNFKSILKLTGSPSFRKRITQKKYKSRLFVTPSNVAEPLLYAYLTAVLIQSDCFIKYSKRTRSFAEYLQKYFKKCRSKILMGSSRQNIIRCARKIDSAVVFGGDDTLQSIKTEIPQNIPIQENGHRISFGILNLSKASDSELRHQVQLAAADVWMYDQRGCCSPVVYFIKGDASAFAEKLQCAMENNICQLGQADRTESISTERRVMVDRLSVLDPCDIRCMHGDICSVHPLVYEAGDQLNQIVGGYQIVGVFEYQDEAVLFNRLSGMSVLVQAFSYTGYTATSPIIRNLKRRLRPGYICRNGRLQKPSALWNFRAAGL